MKTIKLPYFIDSKQQNQKLLKLSKQYSSIVRFVYNRFRQKYLQDEKIWKFDKQIQQLAKSLNNIQLLNSWMILSAINNAYGIAIRFKGQKVIFGGKYNFIKRCKNQITKEEFQLKRLIPINIEGQKLKQGNRSFKLDVIENNQIIFKLNRKEHIKFNLPKLRNNIKKELYKLQQLNQIKNKQQGYTYTIKFDLQNIYISFEEFKNDEKLNLNKERYLGIDLNPDNIGISILENDKILHTQQFSLKQIFDQILILNQSSNSKIMKYYQNKLKFETFEISKSISKLAKHYICYSVYIQDLKFKQKVKNKYNNVGNRKNKNLWKRQLFKSNLKKRLNILNIKLFEVNPAYSSFIGNMQYNYTDSINASIEIARRGFQYRINKKRDKFYPSFNVKHQWKEMAALFNDWKEFYLYIVKNLKLKYRVSLDGVKYSFDVFQQNSTNKSKVLNYVFYS